MVISSKNNWKDPEQLLVLGSNNPLSPSVHKAKVQGRNRSNYKLCPTDLKKSLNLLYNNLLL
jgi:hypothetical protein